MRQSVLLRRSGYMLVTLGLVCGAALVTSAWRYSTPNVPKVSEKERAEAYRKYHARIREGIGREVEMSRKISPAKARRSAESVTQFVEKRSGVSLSEMTKIRLAALEERVQSGDGRRISLNAFSNSLSAILLERFSSLTDEELAQMDETLRGFNAPDMPKGYSRSFRLPGGFVAIAIPREKTIGRLKGMRDGLNTPAHDALTGMFREKVLYHVRGTAQNLAKAVPEQFGNVWNVNEDSESSGADAGLTPLQAFLVAYSLVSYDPLTYNEANLRKYMKASQKYWAEQLGQYPSPDGHRAYGVNGYTFSSPLDLFFDEQTVNRLLDSIEKEDGA